MPNLPDLRAKLKVDLSEADVAVAKAALLGQTLQRELSGTRASSIDSSMKQIGNSIDEAGRKMQNAGTAFVKFGDDGQVASLRMSSATARTKADFNELEQRTRTLGNSLETEFRKGATAVIKLGDDGGASLHRLTANLGETQQSLVRTGGSAQAAGNGLLNISSTIAPLTVAVVALAVAFSPLVITLGAFAVGLTAALSVMALGAAAIGGLAAGVIVLAAATQHWTGVTQTVPQAQQAVATATLSHQQAVLALQTAQTSYNASSTHTAAQTLALQQAQDKVATSTAAMTKAQNDLTAAQTAGSNPLQKLKDDAKAMADTLGQQAAPMAGLLLGWIDQLIPQVQELGQHLLSWFGDRLPGILRGASDVAVQFFGALNGLGEVLGRFLDSAGARAPQFTALFGQMLGFGVDAIDGLLKNLLRLSDWFLARLPIFQPIISSVFGFLGSAVQAVGQAFGRLAEWTAANWPAIVSTIGSLWSNIQAGWTAAGPVIRQFQDAMKALGPVFQYIKDHAENLKPVLVALGVVLAALILVFAAVIAVVALVVAALIWVAGKVAEAIPQWRAAGDEIVATGRRADAIMTTYREAVGAAFSAVGTFIHTAIDQYQQAGRDIGDTFSRIGSLLRQYQADIGSVFSWIGTQLRTAVDQYQQAGRDIGSVFSAIGTAAGGMRDAVGSAFSALGGKVHDGLAGARGIFNNFAHAVNGVLGNFKITIGDIPAFAAGGVLPGYAPGQDSVPAMLSPGEGILTPQTTRALGGAPAIAALNNAGGPVANVATGIGAWLPNAGPMVQGPGGSFSHQHLNAWDYMVPTGSPLFAGVSGTVNPFFNPGGYGNAIQFAMDSGGFVILGHLLRAITSGHVNAGTQIGITDNTGFSTGPHLHFEVRGSPLQPGPGGAGAMVPLGQILAALISPLAGAAHAAANLIPDAWARPLANALIDKMVANVSGRAGGGPVIPGHLYAVGERGPELFSPDVPGQIIPSGTGGGASTGLLTRIALAQEEANRLLAVLSGAAPINRGAASRIYGT